MIQRLIIEYFRIVAPTSVFVVPIVFLIDQEWLFGAVDGNEWLVWFYLWPGIYAITTFVSCVLTCWAKWLLIGYFVPSERPLWSTFVWRVEFINALCESLVNRT